MLYLIAICVVAGIAMALFPMDQMMKNVIYFLIAVVILFVLLSMLDVGPMPRLSWR
jgi:hypothetical protein